MQQNTEAPSQEGEGDKRRRNIYLLPNAITTLTIFGGFYAIIAANHARFEAAAIAIFFSMLADGLDGRVARLTHSQSDFGIQYDSLADMVAFGVAPALVMFEWQLHYMSDWGRIAGRFGWCVAFIYVACAAMRLARFNVQVGVIDKRFFNGLPSPSAAALLMGTLLICNHQAEQDTAYIIIALLATLAGGLLMISRFTYYSFKNIDALKKVPFFVMPVLLLALTTIALSPLTILYTIFITYICSGPYLSLYRYFKN